MEKMRTNIREWLITRPFESLLGLLLVLSLVLAAFTMWSVLQRSPAGKEIPVGKVRIHIKGDVTANIECDFDKKTYKTSHCRYLKDSFTP